MHWGLYSPPGAMRDRVVAIDDSNVYYIFTSCFFTPNHNFYSFPTDLRDLIWWAYYAIISLYEWKIKARVFLYHTHTEARVASQ